MPKSKLLFNFNFNYFLFRVPRKLCIKLVTTILVQIFDGSIVCQKEIVFCFHMILIIKHSLYLIININKNHKTVKATLSNCFLDSECNFLIDLINAFCFNVLYQYSIGYFR